MSQVLDQEITKSDDFYKEEVRRMLNEILKSNEIMNRDQEEIVWSRKQSAETMRQIQENLNKIEKVLT